MTITDAVITLVALGVFLWCMRRFTTQGRAMRHFYVTINLAILSGLVVLYQLLVAATSVL